MTARRAPWAQIPLDNEDGSSPNYGGEAEPVLDTAEDAAHFFARNRGTASIKFVHLNHVDTGDDYRPYDLMVVRPEEVRRFPPPAPAGQPPRVGVPGRAPRVPSRVRPATLACCLWMAAPTSVRPAMTRGRSPCRPPRTTWCAVPWVW